MHHPQHLVESGGDDMSSPTHRRLLSQLTAAHHHATAAGSGPRGSVDLILFNDLVEMVPLVQSLIDRKANSSFTRRGLMTYTKTPSKESLSRNMVDPKARNTAQSIPVRKKKDQGDKDQGKAGRENQDADSFSMFSSGAFATEKDMEELMALREQLDELQRKLLEKDELLKSAETSKNQLTSLHAKLEELKHQAAEKDSVIKSTQLQLSDAKIKLEGKMAALEKIQWEAMTANQKAEQLQKELDSTQSNISSVMSLLEGTMKTNTNAHVEDYEIKTLYADHRLNFDDLDQIKMQQMEEARDAYVATVTAAKERQDEESIAAAAHARQHLQSFVF